MKLLKLAGLAISVLLLSFSVVFISNGMANYEPHYDLVLTNGFIIDGTGQEPYRAQIGIKDNKIVELGPNLKTTGAVVYNFAGFTIAPQKVDWLAPPDWVTRDLASALKRYPLNRLVICDSPREEWLNKSVADLLQGSTTLAELERDSMTQVVILPKINQEAEDIVTGFYKLTGLRSELLEIQRGKIKPGYEAQLIVFNHRQIEEEEILEYLQKEQVPPFDFWVTGSQVQSTKGDS